MDMESSFELIRRAQGGDDDALNSLLERYLPRLRRWARGRLPAYARDLGDTNDLIQEAAIGTFRNFGQFQQRAGGGGLHGYLRTAVVNRIHDEIRRAGRRPAIDEIPEALPSGQASPLDEAIGQEAVDRYERALAQLGEVEREALIARIELGFTYEEVATLVGKPSANAARVAVSRALDKMAKLMSPS
jgi:RNA polymerase sigma-70 factor (ECF subfamily)